MTLKAIRQDNNPNLHTVHPDAFYDTWEGCGDLDCLPGCEASKGHCEQMERALQRYRRQRFLDGK